jgi:hypothetical protein
MCLLYYSLNLSCGGVELDLYSYSPHDDTPDSIFFIFVFV